jgi:nitrogenase-stabilizing/protective protein
MSLLDELGRLSAAEDFFAFLDVSFDPTVVQVARLHILRRMGQYLKGSQLDGVFEGLSDPEIRTLCREHLEQAYRDFVKSSPIQERVFKVHKEAVEQKAKPSKPFVPLGAVTGTGKGNDKDVA